MTKPARPFLDELSWRGQLHQVTAQAALEKHLSTPGRVAYCGFDPTKDSLTIGHLLPTMLLRRFQDVVNADDVVGYDAREKIVVVGSRGQMDQRVDAVHRAAHRVRIGQRARDHVGQTGRRHEVETAHRFAAALKFRGHGPADASAGAGDQNKV